MGGPHSGRSARVQRPTALLSAVATLLGVLFLCLGAPDEHSGPRAAFTPVSGPPAPAFSCPYENGSCGLLPVVTAAVLTASPPDAPADAGQPVPRLDQEPAAGTSPVTPARPRAPDLHVLQVSRT
ncbi:hypothetical protein ABT354_21385 [Streptomyces sp. NPDC000594]|uniref:hypothetical protein n=1 Tax=Streptomyces sp. NPDC000594 TaxID=3154261 RepID=UPI00332C3536